MIEINLNPNSKIIVNPVNFYAHNERVWIDGTDAVFATMNAGFGGFSQAYVWDLCRLHNPAVDPQFIDLRNVAAQPAQAPRYITTEITRSAEGAEALMNNILNASMDAGFQKIRLCQLVFLNSRQEEIFFAIATPFWERLRTGLPPNFPETIFFDVDERQADSFVKTIQASVNKK